MKQAQTNITFSIIIPTLNSEKTIENALMSLANQSYTNFEVLIIDGFSKDGTLKLIAPFKSNGLNINVISEEDKGIYDAMNKGIDKAVGEWLFFMGSDDTLYDQDVLKYVATFITKTKHYIIYGNAKIVGNTNWANDGDIYAGEFSLEKLLNQNICHQAMFYKTQFIRKSIGYFNLSYKKSSDWDFNIRCWAKATFDYMDLIVAHFFAGGYSSNIHDASIETDFVGNVLKYFKISPFHPLVNRPDFIYYNQVLIKQNEDYTFRHAFEYLKKMTSKRIKRL
ncbi:glycosyltransferase family 2 protein [Gaetbulibacter sp. M235]|uniref:glycosyltransferase family 2 protein n=1 Tax=Gaetbulibacter sp. M235 TaxID=3126510 RepID=UPI00374E7569